MTSPIFEMLLNPSTMLDGEKALIGMDDGAVPLLRDFLDGSAKNANGVAYRSLGLPLRCVLEVITRLGPHARGLENHLVKELQAGNAIAAKALGLLGQASETTIGALADSLESAGAARSDFDLPYEAGFALIRLGASEHPSVLRSIGASKRACANWAKAREWAAKRDDTTSD